MSFHRKYLQLQCLLRHCERTVERLVSSDETSGVHKDTARDTRDLVELLVAHTLPRIGQVLAVLEATVLLADGTDAPLALGLVFGEEDVENLRGNALWLLCLLLEVVEVVGPRHAFGQDQNASLGVVLETGVVGLLDLVTSGEPRPGAVEEFPAELLAYEARCVGEAEVLISLLGLWGLGLVCSWRLVAIVVAVHYAGNAEAAVLELLLQSCLLQVFGREDVDAVVVGVKGLDKVCVDLLVQEVTVGAFQTSHSGDDVFSVVHVDETSGGELCGVAGEDDLEAALVVIIALLVVLVLAAYVDDGVAFGEDGGVAGADELGVAVGG